MSELGEDLSGLARSAAAGDRRAAHSLLLRVGPAMLRAVRRVLGRRTEDVEDVVQEAMQALIDARATAPFCISPGGSRS